MFDILRDIRYFVVSKLLYITIFDRIKLLNLILNLFWLYFVNVFISIRQYKIFIENVIINETIQKIVNSKLMFLLRSKFNQTFTIIINFANEINRLTQRRSTTLDDARSSKIFHKNMHESRTKLNFFESLNYICRSFSQINNFFR